MRQSSTGINWSKLVPELSSLDLEKSLAFYKTLGFEVLYSRDNFFYLEFEGMQWMLQSVTIDVWQTAELARPLGRGINFQIECTNVTALRNALVDKEYSLFRDLEDCWRETGTILSGAREFLVQDPDGYLLRFVESLGEKPLMEQA